ncbi:aldehyde dehydrogenase family protein [Crocinitomicaceae bacterium]|nr:aldehyde dehydrogenase family protein [Crocinitomicaceae bacterium]
MSQQPSFKTFNPLKNSCNPQRFYSDTALELESKIQLAVAAEKILSETSFEEIACFLLEIKTELVTRKDTISSTYIEETGLNRSRFEVEFERTLFQLDIFAKYISSPEWKELCHQNEQVGNKLISKKKLPIGPILVMGASNFPLAYSTIGGDSVAALAARCPVVLKSHPYHLGTSLKVFDAIETAMSTCNIHQGTFTHIIDQGHEHASYIAKHESIKGIGFTGSQQGGEAIMKQVKVRKYPIPIFAEMGSVNPIFILDTNNLSPTDLAEKITHSVCNDRGQFCTKPGVIFIPNSDEGKNLCLLLKKNISIFESGVMLHPNMREQFELKISEIEKNNAQLIRSDKKENHHVSNCTLIIHENQYKAQSLLMSEVFGPFVTLVLYDDYNGLENHLNDLEGQLTCSFFSGENIIHLLNNALIQLAFKKAGRVLFNDVPTGVAVCKAMQHGGPYPSSSDSRFTAVGTDSINRFIRDVTIQQNVN